MVPDDRGLEGLRREEGSSTMSLQKFEIVDMASPYIVFTGCLMPLFTCPARSSCESPSQISRSGARDALLEVEGRPVLLLAPRLSDQGNRASGGFTCRAPNP
jgi:hypothetical protein